MQLCISFGQDEIYVADDICRLQSHPSTSARRRQELLEGPVRGLQLHIDGFLVLHGSCVCLAGNAVAIIGHSGAGKSTIASALCQRGAKLVTDGMTAVNPHTLEVIPGPPRTKLTDDSLRMLGQEPEHYTLVHPKSVKRFFPVPGVVPAAQREAKGYISSLQLELILAVEDNDHVAIVDIAGADSLMRLIANTYLVERLPLEYSPLLMKRAASLIQHGVQVKALRRRRDASELLAISWCIETALAGFARGKA